MRMQGGSCWRLGIAKALTVDRQQGSDEQHGEHQPGVHTCYLHRAADTGLRSATWAQCVRCRARALHYGAGCQCQAWHS